jgi:hypothetical protein
MLVSPLKAAPVAMQFDASLFRDLVHVELIQRHVLDQAYFFMKTGREAVYRELRRLDQPAELAPQIVVAEYQAAHLAQHETENKISE